MYKYHHPEPIIINLTDELGFSLREKAAKLIEDNRNTTGAERGNKEQQGFGALAEIVIRNGLGLPDIEEHPLAYDILLPKGIKMDVKCRGGVLPFKEEYLSNDGFIREAKHNFFARQIFDKKLDTDIYLMTHLETPSTRLLPGTKRQKKWKLYICGWVSKKRVIREGVYLPRGSLTEQGNTWFTYRGQEIEFYNKNLNGLNNIKDLLSIDVKDIEKDEIKKGDLNLTSVDALRIAYDLVGRGFLSQKQVEFIKKELKIGDSASSILHPNQYHHLMEWLKDLNQVDKKELEKFEQKIKKSPYEGI